MERSQENSVLLSTKVKSLEATAVTNPRQFAHEAVATKAIRRQLKTFPSQTNAENISNIATFSSAEGLLGRNSEQFISSLQTQYFPPTVPGTGLPMSIPYVGGMITAPGMDPRTLNAGNLLYTYGAPVMSFPNFSGGYGHVQRGKTPEEAAMADKNMNSSSTSRSMEKGSWCPKEPVRTESVIKTVMDRHESTKKSNDTDKRNTSDSQGLNAAVRYPDKERDVAKSDDRKSKTMFRDDQSETNLSRREKQEAVAGDVDHSRHKPPKAKTFDHLAVDTLASKRPNSGPSSRTTENGNLTFSSLSKGYSTSGARSSPYLSEPPTLYPYHNTLPARSSPGMIDSHVPSSMPKLTPIAPRLNNGSPLTLPHSSEAERRNSSPVGTWRQSYSYTPNSHSSGLAAQAHVRWKGNYFDRPPPVDKTDEVSSWRNNQLSNDDREVDRTASYEHGQNLPETRCYLPSQSRERPTSFGAVAQQVRVAVADKAISGKDAQNDSGEILREPMRSSEQIPTTAGKEAFKFGVGPVGFRKETDVASSKLPSNLSQEYQRNQNVTSKSVVGEYVRYNTSDDGKGSLGNVIIHGKAGSYKVSVERREDKPKYLDCIANGRQTAENVKHARPEDKDRSHPGNYNDYEAREPKDSSYMAALRPEFKTVKDIKDKESTDRSRTFDSARYKEQISHKEYAGRKSDSRELPPVIEMRKNNDRNNNNSNNNNNNSNNYGVSLGAYSYFKMYETGSAVSSEQARYFNRGPVKDEKVFVPPNATIEMYERRELEMERNSVRNPDFNSYAKPAESVRTSNLGDNIARKKEELRATSKRDESKARTQTGQFESDRRNEAGDLSADENEDESKIVSNEFASTDKKSHSRRNQTADPPVPVRQHRLSSSSTEHYSGNVHARRPPDVSSDSKLRDANMEAATAANLGIPPSAQFLRMGMDGSALGAPYFSQFLAAPQGRGDAPLLLLDPYGAMYRPHIMEATPQGMFPPGAFAADPVTGSIVMVPEAYIPMMAESQFLLDPRFSGAWGLPGALDESQLQQLYQMMQPFQPYQHKQQQQQQQISERSKQDFFGQQSSSFPWSGYPFFFGKQFESQRKEENNEGKSFDQKQKKRDERPEQFDKKVKEATSKPNTETAQSQDKTARMRVPCDGDLGHQQEVSEGGDQKSLGSNWLKETHQKLSEKGSAIQAQLDAQGKIAKQLKDYLLRDPLSQFSFPGSQNVFMKDTPSVNPPVPTTSVRKPEVGRQSASPKTVSAAVTLSGLERARDGEFQCTGRPSSPANTDACVVSGVGSSDVDRMRSPRLRPGVAETKEAFDKPTTFKEIAQTPRRLEAQPNLAGERSVSRETRQFSPAPDPLHYHEGLLSFGQIASERTVKENVERELVRESIESPYCAFERVPPISYGDVSAHAPIQTTTADSKSRVTDRELALRISLNGAIGQPEFDRIEAKTTNLSNKTPKNERAGLHKEIVEPWEDSRESLQLLISSEKLSSPGQFDSDSDDFEDDFSTKRELQTIASSFVPVRPDLENKENNKIFSLRPLKSEAERKQIRDNIDRLRSMAKRRNSKDRFMVFSRRKDLRSPATILNSVTSAISELAGVESVEKEMRMKLAELQKKYREKARELARLQPKCRDGNEDGNGKSTPPVKRGPGRPRKRKYFGATSKSGKPSPLRTTSPHTPSGAQSPDTNCVPSEPESVISKESEPPKKKKKAKQKTYAEDERRSKTPPSRGFSPVELSDFQVPAGKKKKSSKLSTSEDGGAAVHSRSKQPAAVKKEASCLGKRRKAASPTEINETSTNELESNAELEAPADANKTAKAKKPRPKKRARPKLTLETAESVEVKADDEGPTDSASTTCDTPREPSPIKSKKTKVTNKRRKPKVASPTKGKFEFPDVAALEDSFSENSVSPNEIAKEVVAIATRKQQEAQENNRETSSDNDDEVFTSSHDGRDGLSLLATFATAKKPSATKRKRSGTATNSEELSSKKRGRPKKPMDPDSFDLDVPVTPKKKKKKKVLEEDQTEPKKKKKKKKNIQRVENSDQKPVENLPEKKPEPMALEKESEYPEDPPESPPESPTVNREDSELEGDVYQPIMDLNKDSRRHRSDIGTPRESEDSKMNLSSLLCDEWQPRRSERIFINSSVTTNSSTSPLSPTGKGHEFPWSKKSKKGPGMKSKSSKSASQGEEELGESDVTAPLKLKGKATKKKALGKGKKRSPSNVVTCDDYEPLRVSKRARSRSRLTNDFDEGEEEVDEVEEDDDDLGDEGEAEAESSSVSEKRETQEERITEQALQEIHGGNQSVEERAKESEKQQQDLDMRVEVHEGASQENDKRQASSLDAANVDKLDSSEGIDQQKEADGNPEGSKEDEMESHFELPTSPILEDVRFTFVVEELVEGTKLLLPVDSVFFRGFISTFNEPDLFGVVLDGERGRRPHWRSTEQMLSQAIKDIQPPSVQFLPIGTRVCAHWSPQYRCFYPGSVTEAPPDERGEEGKVWIEFDDGDSGLFQLNEIKRIHPDFPVEEVEATPSLPDKRTRTNSLSTATFNKDLGSKMRSEEIASGFSSENESYGEMHATRRRLRGKKKNKDDTWVATKRMDSNSEDKVTSVRYTHSSPTKEERISKEGAEPLKRKDNKNLNGTNVTSQTNIVSLDSRQTGNKIRGKTEPNLGGKESSRNLEQAKLDMASVTSAQLKQSENEIHSHSNDVSQKSDVYETNTKRSTDKIRVVTDAGTESSDQGEDSEAASDVDSSKRDKGPCASTKGLLRTPDKDLRKRSLTLSLSSSFRSSRPSRDSPTRDNVSTSQDEEDSESFSDAFDESPLVEIKAFQPRLGRRRRSELDRLQADIKSSGPLWHWSGKNFQNKRKGKGKKVFYKAIVRGDETICVGDCAVFMSNPTKNLNLPYVGRIESMWEGFSGNMVVRVKWFYHPEETKPGRRPSDGRQSLYRSTHVDENDVQTIAHKCEVLTPAEFKRRLQSQDSPGTRASSLSDRVFCCIGSYDPNNETLQTEL